MAISPDGASVYVGATNDESIALFSRNATNSKLSFVEARQSSSQGGTVADLGQVDDIAVSPDGKQLYAVGGGKLLRFDRNTTSGALTHAETETTGLSGVRTLVLSADGGEVYAGGSSSPGTIAVYSRNRGTGALTFLESETSGVDDPDDAGPAARGLEQIEAMAISPDDRFLYAAAEGDNALTLLSREDDFVAPETTITSGRRRPGSPRTARRPSSRVERERVELHVHRRRRLRGAVRQRRRARRARRRRPRLEVTATDAEGNTDASLATRSFTVDTKVSKPKVTGADKQKVKGKKIVVRLKLKAGETAEGLGKGDIEVGKKSYKLAKVTKDLKADKDRS
ncbi:MAG: beta-propeller fold lactonase family protein [Solirubrobacterales bacterium]